MIIDRLIVHVVSTLSKSTTTGGYEVLRDFIKRKLGANAAIAGPGEIDKLAEQWSKAEAISTPDETANAYKEFLRAAQDFSNDVRAKLESEVRWTFEVAHIFRYLGAIVYLLGVALLLWRLGTYLGLAGIAAGFVILAGSGILFILHKYATDRLDRVSRDLEIIKAARLAIEAVQNIEDNQNVNDNKLRADIKAIERIRKLGTFVDGWKGPGSLGPNRRAVEDAEVFARACLSGAKLVMPHIALAADGEINFYWKTPKVAIDLSVFGDGTYAYFARASEGKTFSGDDIPVDQNLPAELIELLRQTA